MRARSAAAALLLLTAACTAKKTDPAEATKQAPVPLQDEPSPLPDRPLPPWTADAPELPLQLTASDGTGLRLVSIDARAIVQEPLAFTELHLTFDNPRAQTIEGRFTIDMPPNAAISRFAMKIGDRWQEGEVVERQAARVAYEDFLHRKQDPALLENQAGNRFSARVFPIPAHGRKELIISYSQELADSHVPYRLMLAGLPELERLDAVIRGDRTIKIHETNFAPERDLEVLSRRAEKAIGLRHDTLAIARVPATGSMPPAPLDELTILFDTSASRALGFGAKLHRLRKLVRALREEDEFLLRVVAFDQDTSLVFEGGARDFGAAQLAALYSRRALGASDLSSALRRVAASSSRGRVVLISDGIATAGDSEIADLKLAVASLGEGGATRIDAIIDGGLQDHDALAAITTAGLREHGVVIDGRLEPHEIARKLRRATLSDLAISVPGSTFVWPKTVRGVQAGDEVLVFANLPTSAAMTVVLEGESRTETVVGLTDVERPLLERALASARIDALTVKHSELGKDESGPSTVLQAKIVELSTKYRVLSDFTALLVLETEADYRRFKIDRKALADILVVGEDGVDLRHRGEAEARGVAMDRTAPLPGTIGQGRPSEPAPADDAGGQGQRHKGEEGRMGRAASRAAFSVGNDDEDAWGDLSGTKVGEAFGVGGLGLVGTGRGGGGTGEGTIGLGNVGLIGKGGGGGTGSGYGRGAGKGFGGRGRRVPRVRQGRAVVTGALDKDIIRRIVRSHINEVRHCYNRGLVRNPNLGGRVTVKFTVGPTGKVPLAEVGASTVRDESVEGCIVKAVKRWKFPRPRGGAASVDIVYPFVLEPGGSPLPPAEVERQRQAFAAREAERARRLAQYERERAEAARTQNSPYEGRMFEVMQHIERGDFETGLAEATAWRDAAPGDVLALVALGEALEGLGHPRAAARAYGSMIDLFPSRADLRRYAGSRLVRLGKPGAKLAADTFGEAVAQRPDHPNSHRLHAYALLRGGEHQQAFDALVAGAARDYPTDRFAGVQQILREDIGIVAAAWIKVAPSRETQIRRAANRAHAHVPSGPSTRFVMSWETDANDVDFHIYDGAGGHAYFSNRELASGGRLYADVTTGYGPECFTIEGTPTAFPYRFEAKYYSRGPMGYGMGSLQILQHDGKGGLTFDERPFVIMKDQAFVKLGTLGAAL